MPEVEGPRVVWNSDSLRLAMTGKRYTKDVEPLIHTVKHYALKTLLLQGYVVLVDGTHTTERSIKALLELDINATAIIFDTREETCVMRAHQTGQSDLVPVIRRHCQQIQKLCKSGTFLSRLKAQVKQEIAQRWNQN